MTMKYEKPQLARTQPRTTAKAGSPLVGLCRTRAGEVQILT
jgi:hypothetical protein